MSRTRCRPSQQLRRPARRRDWPRAAAEAAPAVTDAAPMIADAAPAVDPSMAPSAPLPGSRDTNPSGRAFADRTATASFAGAQIETDWAKSPPVELWRRAVGPGWSSFAVDGDGLLHAGAARRRGARLLLRGRDRRAGMAAPRRDPVLGSERRRRSARDADSPRRPRLHLRRDRDPQRARRPRRLRHLVAQRRGRHRQGGPVLGLRELTGRGRRRGRHCRLRHARRVRPRHRRAALVRPEEGWRLQPRPTSRPSTE